MSIIELILAISLFEGTALAFLVALPIFFITVWIIAIVVWVKQLEALELAARHSPRGISVAVLLPFAIGLQAGLDLWVHHLGDIVVLLLQLVMITSIVRNSPFPYARLRRRP